LPVHRRSCEAENRLHQTSSIDAVLAGAKPHLLFRCGRLLGLSVSDGVSEQDVEPRGAATDVYPCRGCRATAKIDAAFAIHGAHAFCLAEDVIDCGKSCGCRREVRTEDRTASTLAVQVAIESELLLRLVPHPVSWTPEGDIDIAPPSSIVAPDATVRSCFI